MTESYTSNKKKVTSGLNYGWTIGWGVAALAIFLTLLFVVFGSWNHYKSYQEQQRIKNFESETLKKTKEANTEVYRTDQKATDGKLDRIPMTEAFSTLISLPADEQAAPVREEDMAVLAN